MIERRRLVATCVLSLAMLTLSGAALAEPEKPFASETITSSSIQWAAAGPNAGVELSISGPADFHHAKTFRAGEALAFSISEPPGAPLDSGQYTYVLTFAPVLDESTRAALKSARETRDEAAVRALRKAGKIPWGSQTFSGTFLVENGAIVLKDATESEFGPSRSAMKEGPEIASTTSSFSVSAGKVTPQDQVIPDDLIVQQSLCVGFDCVNNESFGFDTIRMKENNTRVKFEDTSTGAFPTTDWQLTANDSASGGASKFSIEDITGATVPFTVTAGAPTNSMFVSASGDLGLKTSVPVLDIHINAGDTPAIRFEQNGGSGFTAQTWDVAANEANFFVRDVTGGSLLPFRIRPGAPTSSIDIKADPGDPTKPFVGVNTPAPQYTLDVNGDLRVTGSIIGLVFDSGTKAGVLLPGSFSGVPLKATVTFTTPYPDTNYVISLTPVSSVGKMVFNVFSKSATGFVVVTDKSVGNLAELDWMTVPIAN